MYLFKVVLLSALCVVYSKNVQPFSIDPNDLKEFSPNLYLNVKSFFKTIHKKDPEVQRRRLNYFFDNQFRYVKYYGYYAVPLPDIEVNFKHKVEDTILDGHVALTKGVLIGLDFKRHSNVSLSYNYPVATLELSIGYENLHYLYHYNTNYMSTTTRGGIRGKISDVSYDLILDLDVVDLDIIIQKFEPTNYGEVTNRVEGEAAKSKTHLLSNVTEPIIGTYIQPILTAYTNNITTTLVDWYNKYLSS
ncbi:uncharacterized protein LOC116172743 [Photinus pyralis]|nr:uncharacterized protein LOC116172743 [Photinus pyralis]